MSNINASYHDRYKHSHPAGIPYREEELIDIAAKIQVVSGTGLWDWDIRENSLNWSKQFYAILELDPIIDQPSAERFISMVHPDDRPNLVQTIEDCFSLLNPGYEIEYRLVLPCGKIKHVREYGETYHGDTGEPYRMLGFLQDIDGEKLAEEELKSLKQEMELRVRQHTTELELENFKLKKSLEQIQFAQYQFVQSEKKTALLHMVESIISEINAPIGVAVTACSQLRQKVSHTEVHNLSKNELIEENLILNDYINEFTRLALKNLGRAANFLKKFEKGTESTIYERFNVIQMLNETVQNLSAELEGRHYEIELDCPADLKQFNCRNNFIQVFTNLIMNSVIHGFEGRIVGKIHIEVVHEDENLIFIYSDDGKGIRPSDANSIFEPFYTTQRKHGGSGLGMYFVHNLVTRQLKGNIQCVVRKGQGAQFKISIPFCDSNPKVVYLHPES